MRRHVAVIQASSYPATLAARAATTTIPIVFTVGGDPVKDGLVASLNRPGGNLTGVSLFFRELLAKRRELLRELAPGAAVIGVLLNPNNPNADARSADMQASASAVAQHIDILNAGTDSEIDGAFAAFAQRGVGALLVGDDPLFQGRRSQLAALAARHRTPLSSAELRWDNWHI